MPSNIIFYFTHMALTVLICLSALGYFYILLECLSKFSSKISFLKALPVSIHLVLGFSVLITLISYLSLFSLAFSTTIDALLVLGLIVVVKKVAIPMNLKITLSEFIFFVIAVLWFSFIVLLDFNVHDDFHAYLTFPKMLLESGSLYTRSFSERGLYSLGGATIGQSLFLTHLPLSLARTFEALCAVLSLRLSWDLCRHFKQKNRVYPIILFLLLFCMDKPFVNISSVFSSTLWIMTVLYLVYLLFKYRSLRKSYLIPALGGFTTTFLITFKHINIPISFLIYLSFFLIYVFSVRRISKMIQYALLQTCIILCVLFPFFYSSYQNYSTPLFPFLGLGNHRFAYTDQPRIMWSPTLEELLYFVNIVFYNHWRMILVFVLILAVLFRNYLNPKKILKKDLSFFKFLLVLTVSVAAIRFAVVYKAAYDGIRHIYPLELAFFLLVIPTTHILLRVSGWFMGMLSTVFIMFPRVLIHRDQNQLMLTFNEAYANISDKVLDATYNKVLNFPNTDYFLTDNLTFLVQNEIPAHEKVFLFVSQPYLFDYNRNIIFACDSGATVSPEPHIPFGKPSAQLLDYFRGLGIRYLIYSKDEVNYSRKSYKARLTNENILIQWYTLLVFDLINQFEDLAKNKRYIYENEKYYLFRVD